MPAVPMHPSGNVYWVRLLMAGICCIVYCGMPPFMCSLVWSKGGMHSLACACVSVVWSLSAHGQGWREHGVGERGNRGGRSL